MLAPSQNVAVQLTNPTFQDFSGLLNVEQESTYRRRFRLTLLIVVLCAPALIYGAITSLRQMHTEPSTWVPNSFEERQQYERFTQNFERELAVIISWQGCSIDDPRLERFEDVFASNDTDSNSEYRDLVERVITGFGVVRQLESGALQHLPTVERRRRAAIRRLRGT